VKEAKQMVEESDIKYDEAARKLAMVSHVSVRTRVTRGRFFISTLGAIFGPRVEIGSQG
jgi:hypothetical protein